MDWSPETKRRKQENDIERRDLYYRLLKMGKATDDTYGLRELRTTYEYEKLRIRIQEGEQQADYNMKMGSFAILAALKDPATVELMVAIANRTDDAQLTDLCKVIAGIYH